MLLIGEYSAKLTDKNRVALPKKFREILGSKVIITNGYEGCLIVVSEQQFEILTEDITMGRFVNNDVRDSTRFLLGGAVEVELDGQGRFVLPSNLLDYAGMSSVKDEMTFLGLKRWVELWSKEKWEEKKLQITNSASDIAQRLEGKIDGSVNLLDKKSN